ncbi:MAG: hypothetical protein AB2417_18165 [Clostridiaceae bacterium]
MRDIQEILIEMDKISEQIATTLDEGTMETPVVEEATLLDNTVILDPPVILNTTSNGGCGCGGSGNVEVSQDTTGCTCSSNCPPSNDRVPFCCKVSVPIGFNVRKALGEQGGPAGTRSLAVVSCLHCFVDPNPCQVTVTRPGSTPITANLFPIKVIGCIQFIASLSNVQGTCGINGTTNQQLQPLRNDKNTAAICCQSSICVNQVVGFQGTAPTTAQSAPKPIPCNKLEASLTVRLEDCDCKADNLDKVQVVTFRGEFKLPNTCPPV